MSGQLHALTAFPLEKELLVPMIGGWVGLRAGFSMMAKRIIPSLFLLGIEPQLSSL
jgi:hypothetical protein